MSQSGYAKLADFGLAKLAETPRAIARDSQTTRAGRRASARSRTCRPSRPRAAKLDARSDIFSFGIVLYEMLAGHRPFGGATDLELLQNVIHAEPAPLPDTSRSRCDAIVEKAIEKDPGRALSDDA